MSSQATPAAKPNFHSDFVVNNIKTIIRVTLTSTSHGPASLRCDHIIPPSKEQAIQAAAAIKASDSDIWKCLHVIVLQ